MNDVCGTILRPNRQSDHNKEQSTQTDASTLSVWDESEKVPNLRLPRRHKRGPSRSDGDCVLPKERHFGDSSPNLRTKFAMFTVGHAAHSSEVSINKYCSGDVGRNTTKKMSVRRKVRTKFHKTLGARKKFFGKGQDGSFDEGEDNEFSNMGWYFDSYVCREVCSLVFLMAKIKVRLAALCDLGCVLN